MYLEVRDVRVPWCNNLVRSNGTARAIHFLWRDRNTRAAWRDNYYVDGILVLDSKIEITGSWGTYGKVIWTGTDHSLKDDSERISTVITNFGFGRHHLSKTARRNEKSDGNDEREKMG